ncbi:MAG: VPLPA-CTERM-specific exosortase XrtD [Chromatiales bacterium 21-64-14]|nr:MAG: VPLPA-CTERM-specific exosortase XrtD [Chromatiales bacterium 21-64-14]
MVSNTAPREGGLWRTPIGSWALFSLLLALLSWVFRGSLGFLVRSWAQPEYGYAYLIPFISAFLIWQRKDRLEALVFTGSSAGVALVALGLLVSLAGRLGAVHTVIQYGVFFTVLGMFWAFYGTKAFRTVAVPLLLLGFAIPLPGFFYQTLSNNLQLLSSRLGVDLIHLFNVPVFLEGNVIDLGVYKLQVVEACSGLRYLFPLTTLAFVAAYLYQAALWKRAVVFLSALPITVFMNSFRIGVIGMLVGYWGISQAEGFLHWFEGWAIFMACILLLLAEMWVLTRIGRDRRPFREAFSLDFPAPTPPGVPVRARRIPTAFWWACALLLVVGISALMIPNAKDVIPARRSFTEFPLRLGPWTGTPDALGEIYLRSLNLDDYILADYRDPRSQDPVNLYIGYYDVQRANKVPHSPKACLPGGGWLMTSIGLHYVKGVSVSGVPLRVNRVVISREGYQQLVYYWFQERGRVITNEYAAKYYILVDSITRHRTDGALVRLVTMVGPNGTLKAADQRLTAFARRLAPILPTYVPD